MSHVTGLEGVVVAETQVSLVDGEKGHLVYRGHWAKELALNNDFEEVAYLLLFGSMPSHEQKVEFTEQLKRYRSIPASLREVISRLPLSMDMMSFLRTAISAMGDERFLWPPSIDQAIKVIAILPTLIAYRTHQINGTEEIEPNESLNHIENYLYMLHGYTPAPIHVQALTAYFILTMEHGMNASTFSARAVLSTQSDYISAIVGAIGAMKGPLHGGAPSGVIKMLNEIATPDRAEAWLRSKLEQGERLMGFGHRVYKTHDPRAQALRNLAIHLSGQDPWLDLALLVEDLAIRLLEEYKPGRRLYTNVEYYAAAVMRAIQMPDELFTPTFTASRAVGWSAHILEQAQNNRIFRPESRYVGRMPE
jgi:citrate synthase